MIATQSGNFVLRVLPKHIRLRRKTKESIDLSPSLLWWKIHQWWEFVKWEKGEELDPRLRGDDKRTTPTTGVGAKRF